MKIGFLSLLDPNDINIWSGTLHFIFKTLKQDNQVEWLGGELLQKIGDYQAKSRKSYRMSCPEAFAKELGSTLSKQTEKNGFDVLIVLESSLGAYIDTAIPIVYLSDTTFRGFRNSLSNTSDSYLDLAEITYRKLIDNVDLLIYSSEWAKKSALDDYDADSDKVKVVEFGANLLDIPPYINNQLSPEEECRLVFIGRDKIRKGCDKVYDVYKTLRSQGYNCSLSIIGSVPTSYNCNDQHLRVIPFINKSNHAERDLLDTILRHAHFLVLPTNFDCFGIVFCEASAYGVPSITSDVGGVPQVIENGKNGFLLPVNASALEYAEIIRDTFDNKEKYSLLRDKTRQEYDKRLNWDVWRVKINTMLQKLVSENAENPRLKTCDSVFIPTYVINLPERTERRAHIESQFSGRAEFNLIWVDACRSDKGTVGLWESIKKAILMAQENDDEIMIICEDDHYFTEHYDKSGFLTHVVEAYQQGAELLIGGVGGFGAALPVAPSRYWVDWYWSNQFIVIYKSAYRKILDYQFADNDTADGVLSKLLKNKQAIHPLISRQKNFGYSDVTLKNHTNPEYIEYYFTTADARLKDVKEAYDYFYPTPKTF